MIPTFFVFCFGSTSSLPPRRVRGVARGVKGRCVHRGDDAQAKRLGRWLKQVTTIYAESILPFDEETAHVWGRLRVPNPVNPLDKQIAATALIHDLTVVTRNTEALCADWHAATQSICVVGLRSFAKPIFRWAPSPHRYSVDGVK
jgi:hypothetical protein